MSLVNKNLSGLRWLFGQPCPLCRTPLPWGDALCAGCSAALPTLRHACRQCAVPLSITTDRCGACQKKPPAFDDTIALFRYETPIDRMIHGLKYRGQLDQARLLGGLLAQRLRDSSIDKPDCLLPVPLHPARLRERGYNQSLELAKPVARALALPIDRLAVTRVRATRPQMELTRDERARNLRNAFQTEQDFRGRHIAIVDDVMTSGHTVNALARCLKRAGARRVSVWVVARA